MKRLILSLTALIFLTTFCIYSYNNIIYKNCKEISSQIETISENVKTNRWDKANENFEILNLNWKKVKKKWSCILNHKNIDSIDISLAKLKCYIQTREKNLTFENLVVITSTLEIIKNEEKLSIGNIL